MSASEHTLIELERRIQSTLHALRQGLLGTAPAAEAQAAGGSTGLAPAVQLPRMSTPAARPRTEEMAERDLQIAKELLHLQRTLSRQTFRGAESARRLVRRLIRRAELNARELRALSPATTAVAEGPNARTHELPALLERLSAQLGELETYRTSVNAALSTPRQHPSDTTR